MNYNYSEKFVESVANTSPIVEANYAVLGDANLNKGSAEFQERKPKEWMELFDPRTDSLGPIKL